jgi:hypothetical protein
MEDGGGSTLVAGKNKHAVRRWLAVVADPATGSRRSAGAPRHCRLEEKERGEKGEGRGLAGIIYSF